MMNTGRRQEITKLLETGREAEEGKIGGTLIAPRGPSEAPVGRRFGDLLVSDGLITQPQIDQALSEQKRTGEKLGEILVRLRLITEDRLGHFLSRHYGIPEVAFPARIAPQTLAGSPGQVDLNELRSSADEVPIVRLVNSILLDAMKRGASDIHVDPGDGTLGIRYRIDGILHEVMAPPKRVEPALVSRLKIMANLDIAERRLPQDGRIKLRQQSREIDFRVSVLPSVFGESVVLRLLDKQSLKTDLTQLGFEPAALGDFQKAVGAPHGLIVITGPTGSGKTTTLYSALHTVNSKDRNIVTVEDPVEYELVGATQVQVSDEIGRTFAAALRSFLRHDPDVILVGEMRDQETAQIAVRAALAGHLVLSTLHTNSAAESISRLTDMGVPPFLLSSSLRLVVAQRLARKVCQKCREPYEADEELLIPYGHAPLGIGRCTLYKGRGCDACHFTGMKGRIALYEVLAATPEIRGLILASTFVNEIRDVAAKQGMKTLREAGLLKVLEGVTTPEEVLRVTTE